MDEDLETGFGIEAIDLASLLFRFEEATSSEIDGKVCVDNESTKDMLIKATNSKPDLSVFPVRSKNSSRANDRNAARVQLCYTSILPKTGTHSTSGNMKPVICRTENTGKPAILSFPSSETQLQHVQAQSTVVASLNSRSVKMVVDSVSSAVLGSQEPSSSVLGPQELSSAVLGPQESSTDNILFMTELMLHNDVSKCDTFMAANPKNSESNASVEDPFQVSSPEVFTECSILSNSDAFETNSDPISSHELAQLQCHQNLVPSITTSLFGDEYGMCVEDFINSHLSHDLEHGSDIGNCIFEETHRSIINFDGNDIVNEWDHKYCLNNPLAVSAGHQSSKCCQEPDTSVIVPTIIPVQSQSADNPFVTRSQVKDESVVEEREVFVDSDGNDLYSQDPSQLFETGKCQYNQQVIFKAAEKKDTRKRPHSCLQHHKHNTNPSSIHEDKNVFYDKIPSYYTALSIPLKPVTTTVFESTTKAVGTTDHLDLLDASGPSDEGHYDKVPAHRRCFTNTIKDVDIKCENSTKQNIASNIVPKQQSLNHSAHETSGLSLPFQSVLSRVDDDDKHASVLYSHFSNIPGQHRRSRSTNRRSSSTSRFSRRSASSMSDCSTCSSCSYRSQCSTCSIFSRSSSSSGSESGSSRSRSPSPSRGNNYTNKRMHRHFTPSKVRRSRSRTVSPCEDSGWRPKQQHRHNSSMEVKSERRKIKEEEQATAMEERRIVYVGKIPDGYTKRQLYQRFQSFGEIKEVKLNFREHGDNYGFVTFAYACDAISAKEKGNSIPGDVKFDLCFGGRRHFCPDQYADLDGNREIEEEYAPMSRKLAEDLDYAALLKMHSTHQRKKVA